MAFNVTPVQTSLGHGEGAASFTFTLGSTPLVTNFLVAAIGLGSDATINLTSTNTTWRAITPIGRGGTSTTSGIWLGIPRASAGTTVTAALAAGTNFTGAGVIAEFTGIKAAFDNPGDVASGTGASVAVTISAGNYATELLVACITERGTWATSGQTLYSSPTNSFAIIGQQNSMSNSANADRAVVMLAKLVTSSGSVSAGATGAGGNFGATGVGIYESPSGFFIQ